MLMPLGYLTFQRNAEYREPMKLWQDVVNAVPKNPRGHMSLGASLVGAGSYDQGIEELSMAIKLRPATPSRITIEELPISVWASTIWQSTILTAPSR